MITNGNIDEIYKMYLICSVVILEKEPNNLNMSLK